MTGNTIQISSVFLIYFPYITSSQINACTRSCHSSIPSIYSRTYSPTRPDGRTDRDQFTHICTSPFSIEVYVSIQAIVVHCLNPDECLFFLRWIYSNAFHFMLEPSFIYYILPSIATWSYVSVMLGCILTVAASIGEMYNRIDWAVVYICKQTELFYMSHKITFA